MVRPRAWAVLRLITSSNFLGCSTGRSPGLAPLRTLSTYCESLEVDGHDGPVRGETSRLDVVSPPVHRRQMLGNREVGDSGSLAEIERIILDDGRGDSRGVIPLNAASKSPGRRTSTETTSAKASVRAAR